MKKFGLNYVRPSKVEKDLRRAQSKDGRVGRGAAEHLAAVLEFFLERLWARLRVEAGPGHQVQLVHVARAFADPDSGFHGVFPTRVAGVFLPVNHPEPVKKGDDAEGVVAEKPKKTKKASSSTKAVENNNNNKKPKQQKKNKKEKDSAAAAVTKTKKKSSSSSKKKVEN